jgi:hypothetical protein
MMSPMHQQPQGAAFDVVLLLHVGCVVAGFVTTLTAATTAARLRRLLATGAPVPEALRRYFKPGVNWAGRLVWGIPAFGFALVAMSQGAYAVSDGWVLAGLVLFVALAGVTESLLWPAERRVQEALAGGSGGDGGDGGDGGAGREGFDEETEEAEAASVAAGATVMVRSGGIALVLLVVGTVIMIAQP